jgi:hypothetical protein
MNERESPGEAPTPVAGDAAPGQIESLIEGWWSDHFPGSPIAQVTQAWNQAVAAKEELKRRLAAFLGGVA